MDILRTLAHEFIHYKQHMEKGLDRKSSHAGSPTENQANAKAGEIMRKYGTLHPELFDLMPLR
jgi:Zn-dependent peptidase ImmA (M78 family)